MWGFHALIIIPLIFFDDWYEHFSFAYKGKFFTIYLYGHTLLSNAFSLNKKTAQNSNVSISNDSIFHSVLHPNTYEICAQIAIQN